MPKPAPQHFDYVGKSGITWTVSSDYAKAKGGRLATLAEVRTYMNGKPLVSGYPQWVAVTEGYGYYGVDWVQVGNVSYPTGASLAQTVGAYEAWQATSIPTPNYYVFWMSS